MTTKLCNHCKKEKDITDFYKRKSSIDGYDFSCKACTGEWNKNWYKINHRYALITRKNYRKLNKEKCNELTRKWLKNHPDKVKEHHLKQKAERKNMGYIKLFNNPFPNDIEIDWHHINDMLIVPIPKKIHSICSHNNRDEHRNKCNVWIYQLYGIDVSKLLCKRS